MKKIVFLVLIAIAVTTAVWAQNYTVQSVSGRVQRETGNSRVNVAAGDVLSADAVIHLSVGSTLVLREGERTFNISANQNGRLGDLIAGSTGVRLGGNVAQTDTGAVGRTIGQIGTASTRASEAAEDDDIAAE